MGCLVDLANLAVGAVDVIMPMLTGGGEGMSMIGGLAGGN
jgi:hypothetical protein